MLRLLGFVVLVAVVVLGFGYYRGWFDVESAKGDNGRSVTLSVDESRAKEDLEKGKAKAGELLNKGKEAGGNLLDKVEGAVGGAEVEGTVFKVNVAKRRLRVTPTGGGTDVGMSVPTDDIVRRNGAAATLADLQEGDTVTATTIDKSGGIIATKVEASGP